MTPLDDVRTGEETFGQQLKCEAKRRPAGLLGKGGWSCFGGSHDWPEDLLLALAAAHVVRGLT